MPEDYIHRERILEVDLLISLDMRTYGIQRDRLNGEDVSSRFLCGGTSDSLEIES